MPGVVTLHEEMASILVERGRGKMSAGELSEHVNARGRYAKGDGSPMTPGQIRLRARKYPELFTLVGSTVILCADVELRDAPLDGRTVQGAVPVPTQAGRYRADVVAEAVGALAAPGRSATDAASVAPNSPGLYAISASPDGMKTLGFERTAVIYIGKSESSLARRDLEQHFAAGQTGRSTLRRSLAALLVDDLDLEPRPRNLAKPAHFDRYALDPEGERRLSDWMSRQLRLAFWAAPSGTLLRPIEIAAIGHFSPPLNLTDCITPHTARIKAGRRLMADRARAWAAAGRGS